jgi:hypothetical protein
MKELQFDLLYSENVPKIQFEQEVEIDFKPRGFWSCSPLHQVYFQAQQSTIDKAEEEFLEKRHFSQAQYQAADLHKCLPNHLSSQEKEKLYALLDKHRFLFKGTLGLLPTNPVHVEIIPQSPHSSKSKEPMTLQVLTIIDLSTHFMEIVALKNKESITVARSLNQVWLCRDPRPVDCLHDNGTEFVSTKFQELLQSYGI